MIENNSNHNPAKNDHPAPNEDVRIETVTPDSERELPAEDMNPEAPTKEETVELDKKLDNSDDAGNR